MDALATPAGPDHRPSGVAPAGHRFMVPIVAAALVLVVFVGGWRGGDWPAQIYRAGLFRRFGLTLWNAQWYGGHWTLTYSTLFPAVAGWIGLYPIAMLSVVTSVWAFDRLAIHYFGPSARAASYAFVTTLIAAVVIGQLTFLLGLAFGLMTVLAFTRQRWVLAVVLALFTASSSPLAAAFLTMVTVTIAWSWWPRHRVAAGGVVAAAVGPVAILAMLFPRQGAFPFRVQNLVLLLITCACMYLIVPRSERGLRRGIVLYAIALVVCFVPQTPMGANVDRFGRYLALPLLIAVAWPQRRKLVLLGAIPLLLLAWLPAVRIVTVERGEASTSEEFYEPVVNYLDAQGGRPGRVEIVPTRSHWEVAFVAPTLMLARGWERQVDTADNPLFYEEDLLDAQTYLVWLKDNGVRWVALPEAPLDYAGEAEGALVRQGVPGLRFAWTTPTWTVFEVEGSDGIVSGPADLVEFESEGVDLMATGPGMVTVRVSATAQWELFEGSACLRQTEGRWLELEVFAAGPIHLEIDATDNDRGTCQD